MAKAGRRSGKEGGQPQAAAPELELMAPAQQPQGQRQSQPQGPAQTRMMQRGPGGQPMRMGPGGRPLAAQQPQTDPKIADPTVAEGKAAFEKGDATLA